MSAPKLNAVPGGEGLHGWMPLGFPDPAPEFHLTKAQIDAGVKEMAATFGNPYSVRVAAIFAAMMRAKSA